MSDVLADRCASMKELTMELMQLAVTVRSDARDFERIDRVLDRVKAVVALGSAGIDSADYDRWIDAAGGTIARMSRAVQEGDSQEVWDAFTDKTTGFNLLGVACAGQPGW